MGEVLVKHTNRLATLPSKVSDDRTTFDQERREVLDSAFEALSRHPPNADEMAACAYLMRHLTASAGRGDP